MPLLEATVSRRAEWAADRLAADAGAGYDLACALIVFGNAGTHRRERLLYGLLNMHPESAERIAALLAASATRIARSGRVGAALVDRVG